jgi:hypothetical protein
MKNMVAALAAAAVLLAGCDSPTEPAAEVHALATVNGRALPAPHPDMMRIEIVSGTLTLKRGNVAEQTMTIRCVPGLTPDECSVSGAGLFGEGTYSRTEGWLRFGDRQYPAEFTASTVTADYRLPPSQGFGGAVYVYTRQAAR